MHFVEGLGLRGAELDEAGGADGESGGLQVRNDLSREASLDRVGLDDGECEHVKGLGAKGRRTTSPPATTPTTTPSRTTGKRSTSLELIKLATSARVWSSARHRTDRAIASLAGMSCGSAEPRCS